MVRLLRAIVLPVLLTIGLVATPGVAAAQGLAGPANAVAAWHCKVVIAVDIRVFRSPTGTATWGSFRNGAIFYVDRTDNGRYHTQIVLDFVVDAWTTSDPRWVASC